MKARILTSIGIVVSIILMLVLKIYVSPYFFDAFFVLVGVFAAYEMSNLLTRMGKYNNPYVIMSFPVLMGCALILGLYFNLGFGYCLLLALGVIILLFMFTFLFQLCCQKASKNEIKVRGLKKSVANFSILKALHSLYGMLYPTFLFMFAILLNHIDEISLEKVAIFDGGLSTVIILFLFLIPMLTDTFAMLCGMVFGGPKLAPKTSPNKTVSGAIGGSVLCVLLSGCIYLVLGSIDYFAAIYANFPLWQLLVLVVAGTIVDQCGDLFESFLKRKAGVKDAGTILPGHGGMLDRIDAYIFVAPILLVCMCFMLI